MQQKENYKKINIMADDLDETQFDLEGVSDLSKSDHTVSFFYRGDINQITKIISANTISDVSIEEPTLEEIFMHYYE